MVKGKIDGIRLLKDGNVSVMLTLSGDDLQAIASIRAGNITIYGDLEAPAVDDRETALLRIRSLAEQVVEMLDKELQDEELPPILAAIEAGAGTS